jgi:ketosteroid isomerase-like protein
MTDLPAPVRAALDAANAGDVDAFLACFPPDGVVDDWGREFTGPEAIRRWSDREFIGVHVTLDVTEVTGQASEVTVTAQVGGDGFRGPSHFTFRTAGDRVERMTIRA